MSKVKSYKEQEDSRAVNEPAIGYSTAREEVGYLPDEVLVGAIKYVQVAREKGRMIPNKDVYGLLSENMGWKARSSSLAKSSYWFSNEIEEILQLDRKGCIC